ncbi:Short-chain dehydrogenase/reductase sat3 [Apiospora arundinis]
MARALAFNGAAKVYLLGRRLEPLEAAAKEHPSLVPVRCDVTSKADLQAAVDFVKADAPGGCVNLVVANSGTIGPADARFPRWMGKPLAGGSGDVPAVQSQVIFTTSVSAFSRHWSSSPPYLTSKVAIMQVAKHASTQLARFGIRVNAIAPGLYPSELSLGLISSRNPAEESPDDQRFIPARRWGTDEEMSGAILYLASRAGSYFQRSYPDH